MLNRIIKKFGGVILLTCLLQVSYGQGVGSMTWNIKNDKYEKDILLSIVFNGKTYMPRHRNIPIKNFWYNSPVDALGYANNTGCYGCKIDIKRDSIVMDSYTRPVELYVIDSLGNWCLTSPGFPIFTSLTANTKVEVELSLVKSLDQFMKPIDKTHFILATKYRTKMVGQTSNSLYPILFLFEEGTGKNYPIKVYTFTPTPENGNHILDMKVEGKNVKFPMSNGKTVTLTFAPEPGYKLRWMSSDGEFVLEQ